MKYYESYKNVRISVRAREQLAELELPILSQAERELTRLNNNPGEVNYKPLKSNSLRLKILGVVFALKYSLYITIDEAKVKVWAMGETSKQEQNVRSIEKTDWFNEFEDLVFHRCLEAGKKRWVGAQEIDVAPGGHSCFVDTLVVTSSCLIVVEAKHFRGVIRSEGNARNTDWYCIPHDSSHRVYIKSPQKNPYLQVDRYAKKVKGVLHKTLKEMSIYSLIVFPENTDVSSLKSDINGWVYVTTVDELETLLPKIENEAKERLRGFNLPEPEKILNLLLGKPIVKH